MNTWNRIKPDFSEPPGSTHSCSEREHTPVFNLEQNEQGLDVIVRDLKHWSLERIEAAACNHAHAGNGTDKR